MWETSVERFNTAQVFGILNCSAKITGTFDDPDISAVMDIQKGMLMKKPFEVYTSIHATKKLTQLYTMTGKLGNTIITSSSGAVDWKNREYRLKADMILSSAIPSFP